MGRWSTASGKNRAQTIIYLAAGGGLLRRQADIIVMVNHRRMAADCARQVDASIDVTTTTASGNSSDASAECHNAMARALFGAKHIE